jgi:uncharacterized OsmC-like protein
MPIEALVKYSHDDVFEVDAPDSAVKLYIDKRTENHSAEGSNPLEMFLASVGGCVGVYAKRYLSRHEIPFKKLNIHVKAELSQDPPMRLSMIHVQVETDARLDDKKDVFERFIRNCPVHNTLLHTKEVTIQVS